MNRTAAVILVLFVSALLLPGTDAMATNGMNLEGYGPIAAGMGGASFGYWNGTAAMMNNPATLSFLQDKFWLDIAVGNLGPNVEASLLMPGNNMSAESLSDAFYMPAIGFLMRKDAMTFGFGVYSQGGMGTEYGSDSWLADPSMGTNTALEDGLVNRSEVGVGRVIVPFTYDINDRFSVGASVDFIWAGMDLQMAMSEGQFQDLANPMSQNLGTASGSLVNAFGMMYEPFGGSGIATLHHAYFDFTNDSDFTGEAKGTGFAGKIGAVFTVNPKLTIGATYHSKTFLGDLETDNAALSMAVNADPVVFGMPAGPYVDIPVNLAGKITVKDFQWPAMIGFGAAFRPDEKLLLAADIKLIQWADVMEDFQMTFKASDAPENGGFADLEMDATLFQEWENQFVLSLGGAYSVTEEFIVRAGYNYGKNPVPDKYLNALFPAIVENHLTFGAGFSFTESRALNISMTKALEADFTNPGFDGQFPQVGSTHSQFNWMVMFSNGF